LTKVSRRFDLKRPDHRLVALALPYGKPGDPHDDREKNPRGSADSGLCHLSSHLLPEHSTLGGF
jgi:hypothetical protein